MSEWIYVVWIVLAGVAGFGIFCKWDLNRMQREDRERMARK